MNLKTIISQLIILNLLLPSSSFAVAKDEEKNFDAQIPPFEESAQGKEYLRRYHQLPDFVDINGYPLGETEYSKLKVKPKPQPLPAPKKVPIPKKDQVKKTSFLNKFIDLVIPSAHAADYQMDSSIPGLMHCRDNSSIQGYFKLYFEDMAYNNGSGNNLGFDHPNDGPGRREQACDVMIEIAKILKLDQLTSPLTPDILFRIGLPPGTSPLSVLGAASSFYSSNITPNGLDHGTLYRHIINRVDPTPNFNSFDAVVWMNWEVDANNLPYVKWSVDSDTSPQLNSTNFDFKTVMRHEILHALGFSSLLQKVVPPGLLRLRHSRFNQFFHQFNSASDIVPFFIFPLPGLNNVESQIATGSISPWFLSNNVIYRGIKNIPGASADPDRPIFSPGTWMDGSSLSHFDKTRASNVPYVMHPALTKGVEYSIHQHEKEVLCHLGYQVKNLAGCEGPSPVANDDLVMMMGPSTCLNLIANDKSFTSADNSNLKIFKLEQVVSNPLTTVSYHNAINCSSPALSLPSQIAQVRAIKVTGSQPVAFDYQLLDNGSQRLSYPAVASFVSCQVEPGEHVCNGDFELGVIPGQSLSSAYNFAFNGKVPFWGNVSGSADLVVENDSSQPSHMCNLPYITPSGVTISHLANSNFAAHIASSELNENYERITSKLKQPLVVGQSYKLSLFTRSVVPTSGYNAPPATFKILVGLNTNPMAGSGAVPVSSAQTIYQQEIGTNLFNWTQINYTFQATQAYEYILIHMPEGPGYFQTFVDNISIKKVDSTPVNTHSISGMVYRDMNGNGMKDGNETGIGNIPIRLFSSSQGSVVGDVIYTSDDPNNPAATGLYTFSNLAPNANYYVAIEPENFVSSITRPLPNNFLTGHQHAHKIPFINGGTITNKNFGVKLPGDGVLTLNHELKKACGMNVLLAGVSGGSPNYTFSLTGPNNLSLTSNPISNSTYSFSNLGAGSYLLKVTDAQGHMEQKTITLAPVTPITLAVSANPASLPNYNNGSIVSQVSNGTPPYTFYGTAVSATGQVGPTSNTSVIRSNLSGSSSISYSAYVKDSKGCESNTVSNIKVLKKLTIKADVLRYCNPNPDGSMVVAQAIGGHSGFSYAWKVNDLTTTHTAPMILSVSNGVSPGYGLGTYKVEITDSMGQTASATRTITNNPPPPLFSSITHATGVLNNGSITIQASGWAPNTTYTFSWSDGVVVNSTSNVHTRSNLAPGAYTLTLSGSNSYCQSTTTTFYVGRAVNGKVEYKEIVNE